MSESRPFAYHWFMRDPFWFWWRAAKLVCFVRGHYQVDYCDCWRCGGP